MVVFFVNYQSKNKTRNTPLGLCIDNCFPIDGQKPYMFKVKNNRDLHTVSIK